MISSITKYAERKMQKKEKLWIEIKKQQQTNIKAEKWKNSDGSFF